MDFDQIMDVMMPESPTNLECNICLKKNIKPNEVGFTLGNWKCSIEQCGILMCATCIEHTHQQDNVAWGNDGTIGKKWKCPVCRNYDFKYTMSSLLQYEIPQKALERTMSKEEAKDKVIRDHLSKLFYRENYYSSLNGN